MLEWASDTYYLGFIKWRVTNKKKTCWNIYLVYCLSGTEYIPTTSICKCSPPPKICISFSIFHSFNSIWVVFLLIHELF